MKQRLMVQYVVILQESVLLLILFTGLLLIHQAYGLSSATIDIPMNQTLNNYGTVSNIVIPSNTTNYRAIVNNAGINFNNGNYLQLADQLQYNIAKTDPLTIQFIIKDTYASPLIVARSSVNYVQGYSVEMYNGQMLFNMIGTWGSDMVVDGTGTYRFDDNKVHLVTLTKSSGNPFTLCIYDNATQINCATGSISGSISNTNPIYIGAGSGDSRQVQGQMALFRMWSNQLNQSDITDQFNSIFHPQPKTSLLDSVGITDVISTNHNHMPTNYTKNVSDSLAMSDTISTFVPPNNSHFSHTLFLQSNTHLDYANATLRMVDNFHNTNSFFSFVNASGTNNVSIKNVNLDCGNLNRTYDVISGTYLVNGNNETMDNVNITNCDHIGLYFKGFTNSHIENVTITKTISNGPAVGTGFAPFGGSNNIIKNIVIDGSCGILGEGGQNENNDESIIGPDYTTNTQFIGFTSSNNCGAGFIASNLGTGNILTGFNIFNNTIGMVLASGQPMTISHGMIWNSKQYGMHISTYGNTISNVVIGQDYNKKGISGIVVDGPNGLTIDHATFVNMPIGIEIRTGGVTIQNSCFINTPIQFKVEAGGSAPTLSNNVC